MELGKRLSLGMSAAALLFAIFSLYWSSVEKEYVSFRITGIGNYVRTNSNQSNGFGSVSLSPINLSMDFQVFNGGDRPMVIQGASIIVSLANLPEGKIDQACMSGLSNHPDESSAQFFDRSTQPIYWNIGKNERNTQSMIVKKNTIFSNKLNIKISSNTFNYNILGSENKTSKGNVNGILCFMSIFLDSFGDTYIIRVPLATIVRKVNEETGSSLELEIKFLEERTEGPQLVIHKWHLF